MTACQRNMPDLLEVRDLCFSYRSYGGLPSREVLSHLDLNVEEGSHVLILGPFDAGKTTLARIISALTPAYLPGTLSGSLRLGDRDLTQASLPDLVEEVGYVSQNPREQVIAPTVEDELSFPLESLGVPRAEIERRITKAMEEWGLAVFRKRDESLLSGGERKRVLLSLIGMVNPKLWVLDESFDDLDAGWRRHLISRIQERDHASIVFASRYLELFDGTFDRVLVMDGGSLKEVEPRDARALFSSLVGDDVLKPLESGKAGNGHVLRADHLTLGHEGSDFHAEIDGLEVKGGEVVALLGENGSGKSSFARVACGLDAPLSGRVCFDGRPMDQKSLNRKVGYLFQNPDLQIFLPTVREELSWSLERDKRIKKGGIPSLVEQVCHLFDLNSGDTPTTMSYPKRKALQGAVYYLLDRPFYILDEPDNALTYQASQRLVELLREKGAGILVITHDPHFASLVAGRSYHIVQGKLEAR